MMVDKNSHERFVWLDWMKFFGIYFIVLGHFSPKYDEFIYVFNVPLFFIISGFLMKRENTFKLFLKKNIYNLILPMIIAVVLNYFYVVVVFDGNKDDILYVIYSIIIGNHEYLGACWFIYTLFIMKTMYQILPPPFCKYFSMAIFAILTIIAIYLFNNDLFYANSVVNVCLSYQFFYVGFILKKYKTWLNNLKSKKILCSLFFISVLIVYLCGRFNGKVFIFNNSYGEYFIPYLLGGVFGTVAIYVVSKWLNKIELSLVSDISVGSIIIVGLHWHLIRYVRFIANMLCVPSMISALFLVLCFIPLIAFCKKYFPYAIGLYRVKR